MFTLIYVFEFWGVTVFDKPFNPPPYETALPVAVYPYKECNKPAYPKKHLPYPMAGDTVFMCHVEAAGTGKWVVLLDSLTTNFQK